MPKNSEILSLLLESHEITQLDYDQVMQLAESSSLTPLEALIQSGLADERSVIERVSELLGYTFVDLRDRQIEPEIAQLVSQQQAQQLFAVPLEAFENKLTVAVPLEKVRAIQVKDDLRRITGYSFIDLVVAPKKDILLVINRIFRVDTQLQELSLSAARDQQGIISTQNRSNEIPEELNEENKVIQFVDLIIGQAIRDRASDIHFDPNESSLQIRYRIDGILQDVSEAPAFMMREIASRVKIMARLDISKTRIPQDGRLSVTTTDGRRVDLRVATLPSVWGEKIVMRVLDNTAAQLPLRSLSFSPENLERFMAAAGRKFGMVLVTGPTGSGKSTTLYSALNAIKTPEINIITVEDPVEYQIKGITQVAVNDAQKLTFDAVLRTVLRSDPDVILVGEIRDLETARISMQAGLTGHMVFSTLHTNDAASALTRLVDMKVEPFIIASTLTAVVSQRLIRKLCDRCKAEYTPTEEELHSVNFPHAEDGELTLYKAVGCGACSFKGYTGRIALHEVLPISERMQERIIAGAKSIELQHLAVEEGMTTMLQDGFAKVAAGLTSIEEVIKVVG